MSASTSHYMLEERLSGIRQRVEQAAERADRDPFEVSIIGVTKTVGREDVEAAYDLGLRDFGENRVQDARQKFAEPLPSDARLHMIGNLQSNKAKVAVELFDIIQSVDRVSLVEALVKHLESTGGTQEILIEVNVAGETQKGGCPLDQTPELLDLVRGHTCLRPLGFMTMAPLTDDPEEVRPVFRGLRELAVAERDRTGLALAMLSMGMSNDFEAAIAEGATHVRIGRAIFGG